MKITEIQHGDTGKYRGYLGILASLSLSTVGTKKFWQVCRFVPWVQSADRRGVLLISRTQQLVYRADERAAYRPLDSPLTVAMLVYSVPPAPYRQRNIGG